MTKTNSSAPEARPLLIHIGYHKTATTWLQNKVFQPPNYFRQVMTHDEIFTHIINPHGLSFDPAPAQEIIARARAEDPGETAVDVISLEALSGLPYMGGRESEDYARRLQAIAPGASILMTIREQTAILGSVYMQYVFRAGTESPKRFFDETAWQGFFRFSSEMFCYDRLVAHYQGLFGTERVLVLPQELIAADQPDAVLRLARGAGNEPVATAGWTPQRERGVSYPQYAVPFLRRVNHLRPGPMNPNPMINLGRRGKTLYKFVGWLARRLPFTGSLQKRRPVTDYIRTRFAGRFADSNRRLVTLLPDRTGLERYQGLGED